MDVSNFFKRSDFCSFFAHLNLKEMTKQDYELCTSFVADFSYEIIFVHVFFYSTMLKKVFENGSSITETNTYECLTFDKKNSQTGS